MNKQLLETDILLENDLVKLIPFNNNIVEDLKKIIFDDAIWEFMGMYVRTEQDLDNYIQDTLSQKAAGTCYPFLIIDKRTNQIAGSTRYGNINYASQKAEIGWTWYGKKFQGTGLNKACKYELLNFAFEKIKFRRIQFSADLENVRSQKAIEKLGVTKEGVFRNNYIDTTGESKDDVYYSIITEDWTSIKKTIFKEFI